MPLSRTFLYLVIGVLAVVVVLLGTLFYQERKTTSNIKIDIGKTGVSIQPD